MFFATAQFLQRGQQQIRHRSVFWLHQMAITLYSAAGAASKHDGQRIVIVRVAITHATAINDQRVIQQRSVAIRRLAELVEEIREQSTVIFRTAKRALLSSLFE